MPGADIARARQNFGDKVKIKIVFIYSAQVSFNEDIVFIK